MLTYSFAKIGSDSLYEYLYKCLKNDILLNVLPAGEKLPSKRSFAKNLGISVITVENAYAQLIAEGFIYSLPKKGYFVADIQQNEIPLTKPAPKTAAKKTPAAEPFLADFSSNSPAAGQFPFTTWAKLLREILHTEQKELLQKQPSAGSYKLRQSIAGYMKEFRGLYVLPEQIIIGAGTEYLYGQIVQLLGHDKCYGIEEPGYQKIAQIYTLNGVNCKHVPLDANGISIPALETAAVDVVHISPSHHFPTGITTPISKRYELLGWAAKNPNRYIIEDDYDSEFRLVGRPLPTLQSIDTTGKVIYLNTFSKSLTSTLRVSFMILPQELLKIYNKKMSFYTCPVTNLIQSALTRFIAEGYYEKHINRMRQFYKKQRNFLIKQIQASPLKKYAQITESDAGLHFILTLQLNCQDREFKQRLLSRGIKINALSEYYALSPKPDNHSFIVNYSSLNKEQIENSVRIINEEIQQVKT